MQQIVTSYTWSERMISIALFFAVLYGINIGRNKLCICVICIYKTIIGRDISYIMFENEDGDLLNFHFGKKITDIDYSQMKEEWEEKWGFVSNRFCLDNYPQEYPSYGYSDLRNPAYQVVNKFGNAVSRLAVKDYIIHNECAVQTDGMPCLFKS